MRVEEPWNRGRVFIAHYLKFAIERIDYLVAVTYMTAHDSEGLPVIDGRESGTRRDGCGGAIGIADFVTDARHATLSAATDLRRGNVYCAAGNCS